MAEAGQPQYSDPGHAQDQNTRSRAHAHALSLKDLPDAWLLQLIQLQLDAEDRLAVFRACTATRDLVLARSFKLYFRWPISIEQAAPAQAALVRACRSSPNVTLCVQLAEGQTPNQAAAADERNDASQIATDINAGLGALLHGTMAAVGATLHAIKAVTLQDLVLDSLMPPWLLVTCPDLTTLVLDSCRLSALPAPTANMPTHTLLRNLHLFGISYNISEQADFARWQHQLRAFPGLQYLSLYPHDDQQLVPERYLESYAVAGAQLTHLRYYWGEMGRFPPQVAAWYPNLSTLHLPSLWVDDDGMEALLSLPGLTQLACGGFQLQQSHADRPCTWTHLSCGVLAVDQFPLVPLQHVDWLGPVEDNHFAGRCLLIQPSSNPQATSSTVTAIAECGGIRWGTTDDVVIHMEGLTGTIAAASLPLLAGCNATRLSFVCGSVTLELLTALQPLLAHSINPHLSSVDFDGCDWADPNACGVLLRSLPGHISSLVLHAKGGLLSEQQFMEVCLGACRPIKVTVADGSDEWAVGWEQRVAAAMDAINMLEIAAAGSFTLTIQ